jgi:hypothetical protein
MNRIIPVLDEVEGVAEEAASWFSQLSNLQLIAVVSTWIGNTTGNQELPCVIIEIATVFVVSGG